MLLTRVAFCLRAAQSWLVWFFGVHLFIISLQIPASCIGHLITELLREMNKFSEANNRELCTLHKVWANIWRLFAGGCTLHPLFLCSGGFKSIENVTGALHRNIYNSFLWSVSLSGGARPDHPLHHEATSDHRHDGVLPGSPQRERPQWIPPGTWPSVCDLLSSFKADG